MSDEELEPLITECPSCGTRFRASEAQLQRARGKVRCGACLTVFDGVEQLTLESARVFTDDDQARRALDDVLNELASDGDADAQAEPPPLEPAVAQPPRGRPRSRIFSGFEEADEEVAEDVSDLVERQDGGQPPQPQEPDVDCSFQVLDDAGQDVDAAADTADAVDTADAAAGKRVPGRPAAPPAEAESKRTASAKAAALTVPGPQPASPAEAAEPMVFGEQRARRPLVWLGIGAGLLLLVAQVLWYQFDDWAKDPQWRAVYAPLCSVIGCTLPEQRDTSLLATRNLAVRAQPEQPGTLLVNAIIINEAEFAQPFPVLELRFTTVRGMLVAGRRFQPREYLAGDAEGMKLIPPRTPVQIELEIDDPGPEAVNYFLRFL